MFYKADPLVFENARKLRNNLTPAEQTFWLRLKEQFPAYKFRRQHPISIYIADFYCHKLKLVIEIDNFIGKSEKYLALKEDNKYQNIITNFQNKFINDFGTF